MFESCSHKDICERFWLASLLHSLMWLVWFELSIDRPNTTNLYIYIACEKGDWAFDSAINLTEESAWTTVVYLALFLHSLCSVWSILHWANFILPLWDSHLEVEEAGLFHAYWAISSYGLCFCRCFLTGFDHKCSLPWNDFLLPLFNTVAHRGQAASKKVAAKQIKLLQIKSSCCK